MRAARFYGQGDIRLEDVATPKPREEDDVLVDPDELSDHAEVRP